MTSITTARTYTRTKAEAEAITNGCQTLGHHAEYFPMMTTAMLNAHGRRFRHANYAVNIQTDFKDQCAEDLLHRIPNDGTGKTAAELKTERGLHFRLTNNVLAACLRILEVHGFIEYLPATKSYRRTALGDNVVMSGWKKALK